MYIDHVFYRLRCSIPLVEIQFKDVFKFMVTLVFANELFLSIDFNTFYHIVNIDLIHF